MDFESRLRQVFAELDDDIVDPSSDDIWAEFRDELTVCSRWRPKTSYGLVEITNVAQPQERQGPDELGDVMSGLPFDGYTVSYRNVENGKPGPGFGAVAAGKYFLDQFVPAGPNYEALSLSDPIWQQKSTDGYKLVYVAPYTWAGHVAVYPDQGGWVWEWSHVDDEDAAYEPSGSPELAALALRDSLFGV